MQALYYTANVYEYERFGPLPCSTSLRWCACGCLQARAVDGDLNEIEALRTNVLGIAARGAGCW